MVGGINISMQSYKENYLIHFGVPGMKWGHRKARVSSGSGSTKTSSKKTTQQVKAARKQKLKTAAKVGAGLAAAGLTAYGAKKASVFIKDKATSRIIKDGQKLFNKELARSGNRTSAKIVEAAHQEMYLGGNTLQSARYLARKRKV